MRNRTRDLRARNANIRMRCAVMTVVAWKMFVSKRKRQNMPIYTCTITESTLSAPIKATLAGEIATIHSAINHVPST